MTYKQAVKIISKNYDQLKSKIREYGDSLEAVWVARSDRSEGYEVDEEWIGITKDGGLLWAYASGCSCWDGSYENAPIKDLKTFTFNHSAMTEGWQNAIIKFAKQRKLIDL